MSSSESKTKRKRKTKSIWMRNVLTRKIVIPFMLIGDNIQEKIKTNLEKSLYNKCSKEGLHFLSLYDSYVLSMTFVDILISAGLGN